MEGELQKIREGVLALMDKKLIRSPSTDESKAFYYKMKSDYDRYLAEYQFRPFGHGIVLCRGAETDPH